MLRRLWPWLQCRELSLAAGCAVRENAVGGHMFQRVCVRLAAFCCVMLIAPVGAQDRGALSIGTGFASGVYFPLGNGIASVINKHVPGYTARVEATGGSVDNLKLISARRIDVGFSMAD